MNNRISGIDFEEEMARELQLFRSVTRDIKKTRRNLDIRQIEMRKKDFYVDNSGQRIKIKDKVNEVKNVLLYEFEFLFKIGFIDVLEKLNKRLLNHRKPLILKGTQMALK